MSRSCWRPTGWEGSDSGVMKSGSCRGGKSSDPARRCWNSGPKRRRRSAGRKSCAGRRNKNIPDIRSSGCLFSGRMPEPFPRLSICQSIGLSVRQLISPSARQSVGPPVLRSASLPARQPIGSSVCLSVCLSAGSLVCKLVSPSVRCSARREGGIAACCRFTGSAGC